MYTAVKIACPEIFIQTHNFIQDFPDHHHFVQYSIMFLETLQNISG